MNNKLAPHWLLLFLLASINSFGQDAELVNFEKSIEKAVVAIDIPFLKRVYAEDFRFKHGSGLVDSKSSWLSGVEKGKGRVLSRETDSVEVEIHGTIGITNGRLTVRLKGEKAEQGYILKYVRVYVKKEDRWEMIMHRTVAFKNF